MYGAGVLAKQKVMAAAGCRTVSHCRLTGMSHFCKPNNTVLCSSTECNACAMCFSPGHHRVTSNEGARRGHCTQQSDAAAAAAAASFTAFKLHALVGVCLAVIQHAGSSTCCTSYTARHMCT
jgi:hypothetical protein